MSGLMNKIVNKAARNLCSDHEMESGFNFKN